LHLVDNSDIAVQLLRSVLPTLSQTGIII